MLKRQRELAQTINNADRGSVALVTNTDEDAAAEVAPSSPEKKVNPSISIISRFPNAKNKDDAAGRNLAPSSSKVLHDFIPKSNHAKLRSRHLNAPSSMSTSELPRLSTATSIVDKSTADSTTAASTSTAKPTTKKSSESNDIQCNEISSSEDEESSDASKPVVKRKGILKASSRLSRELNGLKLESPKSPPKSNTPKNTRRCRTRSENGQSDTENEEQELNRPSRQLR